MKIFFLYFASSLAKSAGHCAIGMAIKGMRISVGFNQTTFGAGNGFPFFGGPFPGRSSDSILHVSLG